jgi:hypothetical protein
MIKTINDSREESNVGTSATTLDKVNTAIVQVGLGFMVMVAGLIGIWSIAAMISATAQAGGLLQMASSWWSAITGM